MIKGIGCDIIDVSRMERAMDKERFLEKVFTPNERELIKNGGSAQSAAGMWAAKEAVSKAFGTGFSGFSPKDIEILKDKNGRPCVQLYGGALEVFGKTGCENIYLSVSHERNTAVAFSVIE